MPIADYEYPTSKENLQQIFEQIFVPLQFNRSVTLYTFAGTGKWANIRFIIDHIGDFSTNYPKTAYLYLDAYNLGKSNEEEVKNGLTFMHAKALKQRNILVSKFVESNPNLDTIEKFRTAFFQLVDTYNQRLVIIIMNAEALLVPDRYAQNAISFLYSLVSIDVTKISFLFFVKSEPVYATTNLRQLELYFTQSVHYESESPFDVSCVTACMHHHEHLKNTVISEHAKKIIEQLSIGSALLTKFLVEEYVTKPDIRKLFDQQNYTVQQVYESVNSQYLDLLFAEHIRSLSPKSKDYLYSPRNNPSDYLQKINVINPENSFVNPLFEHYVKQRSARFTLKTTKNFTPQEQQVMQVLTENLGNIVSRENIARVIWGEIWQQKYSEQAIDRLISNLRSKLTHSPYTIYVAKGAGVKLEKTEGLERVTNSEIL